MVKLMNKETKVVKEIEKEFEASMYLGTGEWEIVNGTTKEEKKPKTPIINTNTKED